MTLDYNGNTFTVTSDSIFRDFSIEVEDIDRACALVCVFDGMTSYTFGKVDYTDMVVAKRTITVTDKILVNVKLRKKTQTEMMEEEIKTLRSAMEELAQSSNKTTTAKINTILATPSVAKGVTE